MPEIIKLIIPVAMLLASLFVTARLSTQNELTAMKSGGMSLYRLMVPYLAVALLVSALIDLFQRLGRSRRRTRRSSRSSASYLRKDVITASGANIYLQDSPTRIISLGYFDDSRDDGTRVSMQDFNAADPTLMVEQDRRRSDGLGFDGTSLDASATAAGGGSDGGRNGWRVRCRSAGGDLHFDPGDLRKKQEKPDEMDY